MQSSPSRPGMGNLLSCILLLFPFPSLVFQFLPGGKILDRRATLSSLSCLRPIGPVFSLVFCLLWTGPYNYLRLLDVADSVVFGLAISYDFLSLARPVESRD